MKRNVKGSLSSGEIELRQLVSFFSVSGLTSGNKWSNRSGSILKYIRKKKEIQSNYFLNYILFHLENGDLERLFSTTKMWISKIQNKEPFKFSKHLFLKILLKFRSNLREFFSGRIHVFHRLFWKTVLKLKLIRFETLRAVKFVECLQ